MADKALSLIADHDAKLLVLEITILCRELTSKPEFQYLSQSYFQGIEETNSIELNKLDQIWD